ncbi:MAG: hypothetical protein ACRD0B_00300 [Acidimicrobiales bacterium]
MLKRRYRAARYVFDVTTDPTYTSLVEGLLAPFSLCEEVATSGAPHYRLTYQPKEVEPYRLFLDGAELLGQTILSGPIDRLLWEVHQAAIKCLDGLLALHAGAVSLGGRGLLLPAGPGSGKTTLVAGLVRAGCQYLSDDMALIEPSTARLLPFPRPLLMSESSIGLLPGLAGRLSPELDERASGKRQVHPASLRPDPIGTPVPVAGVIFPRYEPGSETALEPISRAAAVVEMIANSFNFAKVGGGALQLLADTMENGFAYRMRVGRLSDAIAATMAQLAANGTP